MYFHSILYVVCGCLLGWMLLTAGSCTEPLPPPPADPPEDVEGGEELPPPVRPVPDVLTFDAFWPVFQDGAASMDAAFVAELVVFPLKDAQYMVGRPNDTAGIAKQDFIAHFGRIFDETARARIASPTAADLETIELDPGRYEIAGLEVQGRRLRVNYEEAESTVIYVFGKLPAGWRLIEVVLAG